MTAVGRGIRKQDLESNHATMIENYLVTLLKTNTRFDRPHSPVTVRRHYNMLNQLFNMANRERLINDNPCRQVSRTVLKQLPTWQNRERWLNVC